MLTMLAPKDMLNLGPVYARGAPEAHSSPRLGPFLVSLNFAFLHTELWIA